MTETKNHQPETRAETKIQPPPKPTPIARDAAEKQISDALTKAGAQAADIRVLGDAETILVTASVPVDNRIRNETKRIAMSAKDLTKELVEAAIAAAALELPQPK